jgi:hypothetical protein
MKTKQKLLLFATVALLLLVSKYAAKYTGLLGRVWGRLALAMG